MAELNYVQRRLLFALFFILIAGLIFKTIDRQHRALDIDLKGFLDGYKQTAILAGSSNIAKPIEKLPAIEVESEIPEDKYIPDRMKKLPARPKNEPVKDTGPTVINPNTAPENELVRLPGIGPVLAQRIIAYRDSGNYFSCPQDLLCVKGIGRGKLEQIERYLEF